MPSVRAFDTVGGNTDVRRTLLWVTAFKFDLTVWKIENSLGGFHLITNNESLDKFRDTEVMESFSNEGFDLKLPQEAKSNRTIVLRDVDRTFKDTTEDEFINIIETNNYPLRVDEVVRLPGAPDGVTPLIKIRFTKAGMATRALQKGIKLKYQTLFPKSVEREVFVKASPCSKCLSFSHMKKDCNPNQQTKCSKCAGVGHTVINCNQPTIIRCANCGENHEAYSFHCRERKKYIKDKMKTERQRERNRAKDRQRKFMDNEKNNEEQSENVQGILQLLPPNSMAVIMTAMAAAMTVAKVSPGRFTPTFDNICKINDIPKVKWPMRVIADLIQMPIEQIPRQEEDNEDDDVDSISGMFMGAQMQADVEEVAEEMEDQYDSPEENYTPQNNYSFQQDYIAMVESTGFKTPPEVKSLLNRAMASDGQPPPAKAPRPEPESGAIGRDTRNKREDIKETPKQTLRKIKDYNIVITYPEGWGAPAKVNRSLIVNELIAGNLYMTHETDDEYDYVITRVKEELRSKKLTVNDFRIFPLRYDKMAKQMKLKGMEVLVTDTIPNTR